MAAPSTCGQSSQLAINRHCTISQIAGYAVPVLASTTVSNTQVGSEPFGKCSTLLLFSGGYKSIDLIRSDWKWIVLIVQPLQFHDSLDGPPE
jgi:hypothetical protein